MARYIQLNMSRDLYAEIGELYKIVEIQSVHIRKIEEILSAHDRVLTSILRTGACPKGGTIVWNGKLVGELMKTQWGREVILPFLGDANFTGHKEVMTALVYFVPTDSRAAVDFCQRAPTIDWSNKLGKRLEGCSLAECVLIILALWRSDPLVPPVFHQDQPTLNFCLANLDMSWYLSKIYDFASAVDIFRAFLRELHSGAIMALAARTFDESECIDGDPLPDIMRARARPHTCSYARVDTNYRH